MNIVKGLKTVGSFAVEVVCPMVIAGFIISSKPKYKYIYSYNDAVVAIMESSLWSDYKAKAVAALPLYARPELYEAVVGVARSSMFSDDKLDIILKMCKQEESR